MKHRLKEAFSFIFYLEIICEDAVPCAESWLTVHSNFCSFFFFFSSGCIVSISPFNGLHYTIITGMLPSYDRRIILFSVVEYHWTGWVYNYLSCQEASDAVLNSKWLICIHFCFTFVLGVIHNLSLTGSESSCLFFL